MSVIVTRSIQILCLFIAGIAVFAIFGSKFDAQVVPEAGSVIGFCVVIFLLATILRVASDVGEKLLLSSGYRKES